MTGDALFTITCPHCEAQSKQKAAALPNRRVRVFCKGCNQRFMVDLERRLNCRRTDLKPVADHLPVQEARKPYPRDEPIWRIHRPFAVGFQYSLSGIEVLIRGGMINAITPILAPGSKDYAAAGEVAELKPLFQTNTEDSSIRPASFPPEHDLDGTLDDSKEWFNMDCGEFFNLKVKGMLKREISLK